MPTASTHPANSLISPATAPQKSADAPRRWNLGAARLSNLIVFALLAGVLFFGHHTGWKMPKVTELFATQAAVSDDWCAEHLVPETQCVECQDGLLAKQPEFGFCRVHGVAECVTCHPELSQASGTPRLPAYDTAAALGLVARAENNSRNMLHKRRVQFTSAESAAKAGVEVDVVQEQPMAESIAANGEILFDPTRVAHLSSRVGGTVAFVLKMMGDEVRAGDVLALIDAASVGQAKSQLLHALVKRQLCEVTLERLRSLGNSGGVAGKSILDAESAFQDSEIALISARQTLVNLGFEVPDQLAREDADEIADELMLLGIPADILDSLPRGTKTTNLIPIRAPYDGMIVASDVVAGEVVNTSTVLFTVADPRRMRLLLSVRQEDAKYVARDLPVTFRSDDCQQQVTGRISWLSPTIDERTRTLQVRVTLDEEQLALRDRTFGTGQIILRSEPRAIVVPREAVQTSGDASFVFVRDRNYLQPDAPKVFHVRQVRLGAKDEHYVELLAGALPGEVIATKGSPVLLAQLLRSNLGAGCGCHDH